MTYMKKIIYLMISSVLLFSGCSKQSAPPKAPEQYNKYIFFSQNIATKASLIGSKEDLKDKQFAVVGFKYDNAYDWDTVGANATPDVFAANPQAVTCDANGYGSYSPLQGWSNTKEYTFFAFYPMPNDYVSLVNLDGTEYTSGMPAIKYTLDTSTSDNLKASMLDVMTATHHEDKYWRSASDNNIANGEVTMAFSHRLSSLSVNLRNSSAGAIQIQGIFLDITGTQYQQIIMPLDGSAATAPANPFDIDLYSLSVGDATSLAAGSTTELSDKLILIPQSSQILIDITIVYKRKFGDHEPSSQLTAGPYRLTTDLRAGYRHMISLNFKDEIVEVESKVSTEGWVDMPDVEDTFN